LSTPLLKTVLRFIKDDPTVITKWARMFFRYHYNWIYERYDYSEGKPPPDREGMVEPKFGQAAFGLVFGLADSGLGLLAPLVKFTAGALEPLSVIANPAMKLLLPLLEALVKGMIKIEPLTAPLADKLVDFVGRAHPDTFAAPIKGGS
jgi:hypothetical protein